ncbi:MAG: hypothetical protein ACJAZO_001351 [Myxococcota bacterium]|jgi:hypothetical protein
MAPSAVAVCPGSEFSHVFPDDDFTTDWTIDFVENDPNASYAFGGPDAAPGQGNTVGAGPDGYLHVTKFIGPRHGSPYYSNVEGIARYEMATLDPVVDGAIDGVIWQVDVRMIESYFSTEDGAFYRLTGIGGGFTVQAYFEQGGIHYTRGGRGLACESGSVCGEWQTLGGPDIGESCEGSHFGTPFQGSTPPHDWAASGPITSDWCLLNRATEAPALVERPWRPRQLVRDGAHVRRPKPLRSP